MDNQLTESTIDNQLTDSTIANQRIGSTIDNQLTESTIDNQLIESPIRVKLRQGQYIVTVDKLKIGSIDLNYHVNKCLKQNAYKALHKSAIHKAR